MAEQVLPLTKEAQLTAKQTRYKTLCEERKVEEAKMRETLNKIASEEAQLLLANHIQHQDYKKQHFILSTLAQDIANRFGKDIAILAPYSVYELAKDPCRNLKSWLVQLGEPAYDNFDPEGLQSRMLKNIWENGFSIIFGDLKAKMDAIEEGIYTTVNKMLLAKGETAMSQKGKTIVATCDGKIYKKFKSQILANKARLFDLVQLEKEMKDLIASIQKDKETTNETKPELKH